MKFIQFEKENAHLKKEIDDLKNNLEQQKIQINVGQQYHRTAVNVKLCGVPVQPGEDDTSSVSNSATLEAIKRVCTAAEIQYDPSDIDVCHRMGSDFERNPCPLIIIRFGSKRARYRFFGQRKKLSSRDKSITSHDVDFTQFDVGDDANQHQNKAAKPPTGPPPHTKIFMQEHLTKMNKELLKMAKEQLKDICQFPGYVMEGEVRAKMSTNDKYIPIRCENDIAKIIKKHEQNG